MLYPGDPAPHFRVKSSVNPNFSFETVAGRYIVISFFGSSRQPASERFLQAMVDNGHRFDVKNAIFFGVTIDPADVERIRHQDPGRIYFYDLDLAVSRRFGLVQPGETAAGTVEAETGETIRYAAKTFVLDQAMRVIAAIDLGEDTDAHVRRVFSVLDALPALGATQLPTPVIFVPYVFEPALCQDLIRYYEERGGEESGFMRDVDGKTVGITDYSHKRRMDCEITDEPLIRATQERIKRRVVPAIKAAYQFDVTRIERHIVACYDAEQGAHFKAHRDNTTLGTAHRRFAITLNLNSDEYEGGEIWFPEFGPQRYKAPSGWAIVFSCSMLHEVPTVTRGKRYAFLPFLYDEAAAEVRVRNRKHLGDLSGAGGGNAKPTECAATPATAEDQQAIEGLVIDGKCGCGNPAGCGTCLSAATYRLNVGASKSNE